MAAAVQQLRPTAKQRPHSPEREALAAAIERRNAAVASLERLRAAHGRAEQAVFDAVHVAERAEAALVEAKASEDSDLAEAFIAGSAAAPSRAKLATLTAEEANAQLATARRVRDAIRSQMQEAESGLGLSRLRLDDRVRDVVRAEAPVDKLLAQYAELHREFVARRRVLELLEGVGAVPREAFWRGERSEWASSGEAPWQAAVAALHKSADVELPTG